MSGELRSPVVIDTGVFGASLVPGSPLESRYEPLTTGRPAFVSFQTVAELRYGAIKRRWGVARVARMEQRIGEAEVVYPGPELVTLFAELRATCERAGHALGQRDHDADRWIAATAIRFGVPLVSDDRIFRNVPRLILEAAD